jgi:hypothetical protein
MIRVFDIYLFGIFLIKQGLYFINSYNFPQINIVKTAVNN